MGRGRDKVITKEDIGQMSRSELAGLGNLCATGRVRVRGAAVVRKADGNAKYDDPSREGRYHEDKL